MSQKPPLVYSLASVRYNEPNREIVCSFSNGSGFKSQRFAFFPVLLTNIASEKIISLLPKEALRQVQVAEAGSQTVKWAGASFVVLQQLKKKLEEQFHEPVLLLPPERQFLLQQNWGFFDAFTLNPLPEKVGGVLLPETNLGFLSRSFKETLGELLEKNEPQAAKKLCYSVAWSNLLRLPLHALPASETEKQSLLLENQFFLAGRLFHDPASEKPPASAPSFPLRVFENTAEFDFSNSLSVLCTKTHYNVGLESLNCDCCKPGNAAAENLLPFSPVNVRFLSDAFFFESFFAGFAHSFHASQPEKTARWERQREFGFSLPPIGPFFAGQLAEVPRADAERLENENQCVIAGLGKTVSWFCLKEESVLSKTLADFSRQIVVFQKKTEDLERKALAREKLGGLFLLSKNPHFFFYQALSECWNAAFARFPSFFSSRSHSFLFSALLMHAIEELQGFFVQRFVSFSQSKGFRVLLSPAANKAFVQKTDGFSLAKDFGQAEKAPFPQVLAWHFVMLEQNNRS